MGSGSTVAAAESLSYACISVEHYTEYFAMSKEAIPALTELATSDAQLALLVE